MLFWAILLVFSLPLFIYLIQLYSEKKAMNNKLEKIQKRLRELDAKKVIQDNESSDD
jgi:hypothetical protein